MSKKEKALEALYGMTVIIAFFHTVVFVTSNFNPKNLYNIKVNLILASICTIMFSIILIMESKSNKESFVRMKKILLIDVVIWGINVLLNLIRLLLVISFC